MIIHLLEHDDEDFSRTNISFWAAERGYPIQQTYVCKNEKLPPLDSFDWLMIMGGSQHAWDEQGNPWLQQEKDFIRQALANGKALLGICFGAQLLAEALGGKIFTNTCKEIGWHQVSLNQDGRESFLFENIPDSFTTFHWHTDHFSLPDNCAKLASSEATENQAFVCSDHPLVGLQFHPEYTRDMVRFFAREHSHNWQPDLHVSGKDRVLAETERLPDTYWLMKDLLTNIEGEFARRIKWSC